MIKGLRKLDKETINFYNNNAQRYAKWRSTEKIDLPQKIFLNEIKSYGEIIDLGCGTGEKTMWFQKQGLKVTALDASYGMLKQFDKIKNINIQQMDLSKISFSKKYDGIWASFSIQHLEKTEQNLLVRKVSSALNKSGVFYVGIHEGNKIYRDNLHRLYVPRTEIDLRKIFRKNNFKIFNFFKEKNLSFDNKPINVMHIFGKLKI